MVGTRAVCDTNSFFFGTLNARVSSIAITAEKKSIHKANLFFPSSSCSIHFPLFFFSLLPLTTVIIISMYFTLLTFLTCIMMVIGYPASRFLIEIEEPTIGNQLTKDVMIREDIQTHYENLLDEVISTHDEDFLLKLTYSMTSEKIESLYRPQVNMLLDKSQFTRIHGKYSLNILRLKYSTQLFFFFFFFFK
jgi:hypothetical protein